MQNSIAIGPRDDFTHFPHYCPFVRETMVIGGFPLQRESKADFLCLTLTNEGRSADMPLHEPAMAYFSEVVSSRSMMTISWQCDRPRYDVAYVELISALSIVGYLWNSQELMAISTRFCLQHARWICRNFFPGGGFKWITLSICWTIIRPITFRV